MSSDGEIEIAVSADGAENAAQDLSGQGGSGGGGDGDGGGGGGGMMGGGGGGGLKGNLKSGAIAGVLMSLLGPLLDVLSPILKILQAFLAPLAAFLLRLLQPVLRVLISQVLPAWLEFMKIANRGVPRLLSLLGSLPGRIWSFVSSLPGMIWSTIVAGAGWIANGAVAIGGAVWGAISGGASWLANGAENIGTWVWSFMKGVITTVRDNVVSLVSTAKSLAGDIWDKVKQLADMITQPIRDAIASIPGADLVSSDSGTTTRNTPEDGLVNPSGQGQERTSINIGGGLAPFVETVERSSQVDL